jgi:serine/threonine-protein kinase
MGLGSQAVQGGGASTDALPRRFGSYLLFDRIGRGGMADIYLARAQTGLGVARRVVVKQILPALSGDAHFARMLIDEAKLVAGLRHANIVQVLDLGREDDRLFIAMEYVEGFDLNQLLRTLSQRRIALPAQFALFVVREMLAALDFAHRATDGAGRPLGIVHRDVSPSNVLVSFEGEVKLCDFGIAKALGTPEATPSDELSSELSSSETSSGERSSIAGKAAYMSPEHARGEELDGRADVFAAGIVLWELCAGRRLYRGTETQMLELAREGAVPPLPERGLPLQGELQKILDRALAFDPAERWATAAEMLRAIDDYAVRAKLFASQLRFASFLSEHFEADVVQLRRDRERAAEALDRGPAVELRPVPASDPPAPVVEPTPPAPVVEAVPSAPKAPTPAAEPAPRPPTRAAVPWWAWAIGLVALTLVLAAFVLTR